MCFSTPGPVHFAVGGERRDEGDEHLAEWIVLRGHIYRLSALPLSLIPTPVVQERQNNVPAIGIAPSCTSGSTCTTGVGATPGASPRANALTFASSTDLA